MHYNAYDKDIAIVNIFFGDSTVFGGLHFTIWNINNSMNNGNVHQSLRDRQR